ncbi:hypothetical protein [Hyalangium versicolor]|uniref:hypothetical protein n=1 Tax=Hyalangium versicolor TaxID=2861190 RepID=UPI001CCC68B5|nr:hypothetical protein [Hyalangium versicolor]
MTTSPGKTGSRPGIKAVTSETAKSAEGSPKSKTNVRAVSKTVSRSVPAVRPAPAPQKASDPFAELDDTEPRPAPEYPPYPNSGQKGYAGPNTTGKIVAPEELISDAREFVGELSRPDKIAFAGACVAALSCFLPWKETAVDGDVLGLMSSGIGTLLGAAVVISAIFVRVRRTMPKFNPMVPWGAQIGMSFFCVLYTVIFLKMSFINTEVPSAIGNRMVLNSSPSFGAFLGLLGAIGALTGSVLGLKER